MKNGPCVIFNKGLKKWAPGRSANQRPLVEEGRATRPTIQITALVLFEYL